MTLTLASDNGDIEGTVSGEPLPLRTCVIKRADGEPLGLKLATVPWFSGVVIQEVLEGCAAIRADPPVLPFHALVAVNGTGVQGKEHGDIVTTLSQIASNDITLVTTPAVLVGPAPTKVVIRKGDSTSLGLTLCRDPEQPFNRVLAISGPAAECEGQLAEGDRVVAVNGTDVIGHSLDDVLTLLRGHAEVTLTVQGDASALPGSEVTSAGAVPSENKDAREVQVHRREGESLGLEVTSDGSTTGVRVRRIVPDSAAAEAGIRVDDVILSVDGEVVSDSDHETVVSALQRAGDVCTLIVQHKAAFEVAGVIRIVDLDASAGLGIHLMSTEGSQYPRVGSIIAGMAADLSGQVRVGDCIIAINKISTNGKTHDECLDLIKSKPQLSLRLASDPSPLVAHAQVRDVLLVREEHEPFGIVINSLTEGTRGSLTITDIRLESAAARAGTVYIGDTVLAINGSSTTHMTHDDAVAQMRQAGTEILLTLTQLKRVHETILEKEANLPLGIFIHAVEGERGARIQEIMPNTPAAKAASERLLSVGMVILSINGENCVDMPHSDIVALIAQSDRVALVVEDSHDAMPRLGSKDLLDAFKTVKQVTKVPGAILGLKFFSDDEVAGHVVTEVVPGSVCDMAGIVKGHILLAVNDESVLSKSHQAVKDTFASAGDSFTVSVGALCHVPGALTVTIPRHPHGLGIIVSTHTHQGDRGVRIARVVEGGNADGTLVRAGMRILEANNQILLTATHEEAISALCSGDRECATMVLLPTRRGLPGISNALHYMETLRTVTLPRANNTELGLSIVSDKNGYGCRVREVAPGSVAAKSRRIFAGDRILTFDGHPTKNMEHDEIVELLSRTGNIIMTLKTDESPLPTAATEIMVPPTMTNVMREVVSVVLRPNGLGLGMSIYTDEGKAGVFIGDIEENGYVATNGALQVKDHIIQIDDEDVSAASHATVVRLLEEREGRDFYLAAERVCPTPTVIVRATITKPVQGGKPLGLRLFTSDAHHDDGRDGTYVLSVLRASAAYVAGELQPGDRLVAIDGVSTTGKSHDAVLSMIAEAPGPTIIVEAERPAMAKPAPHIRRKLRVQRAEGQPLGMQYTCRAAMIGLAGGNRNCYTVLSVDGGGPAEKAGVFEGDMLQRINDTMIKADATYPAVRELLDEAGTEFTLTVEQARPNERVEYDEVRDVTLTKHVSRGYGIKMTHPKGEGECPRVLAVMPGTAASSCGHAIHVGDAIVAINGAPTAGQGTAQVLATMAACSEVVVTLQSDPTPLPQAEQVLDGETGFRTVTVVLNRSILTGFGLHVGATDNSIGQRVHALAAGSPAALCSALEVGDVISHINKKYVLHATHADAVSLLHRADILELTVIKGEAFGDVRVVELSRETSEGLGLKLCSDERANGSYVHRISQILPQTQVAYNGDLHYGDRLLTVNGIALADLDHDGLVGVLNAFDQLVLVVRSDHADLPTEASALEKAAERWTARPRTYKINCAPDGLQVYKELGVLGVRIAAIDIQTSVYAPGLRVHDVLLMFNGVSVIGWSAEEVRKLFAAFGTDGPRGKKFGDVVIAPNEDFDVAFLHRRDVVLVRASGDESLGLLIESKYNDHGARVAQVISGQAAAKTGQIHVGDDIIMINGRRTFDMAHSEVVQMFQDGVAQGLTLTVQDNSAPVTLDEDVVYGTTRTVKLTRGSTGLGLEITGGEHPGEALQVSKVTAAGAAHLSNEVFVGDLILQVDGVSTIGKTHEEVIAMVRAAGDTVELVLESSELPVPGADKRKVVTLKKTGPLGMVVESMAGDQGVRITNVVKGSPADLAPMLVIGDRVLEVNGVDVSTATHAQVINAIHTAPVDVTLVLLADNNPVTREVVLDSAPTDGLGVDVESRDGVVYVVNVVPGKAADVCGTIFPNDILVEVNNTAVNGLPLDIVIGMIQSNPVVRLLVRSGEPDEEVSADLDEALTTTSFSASE